MQGVSHNAWQNLNEITQFTPPQLWFFNAFWLTSINILQLEGGLGGKGGERGWCEKLVATFFSVKKIKNNFIAPELYLMTSHDVELKSAERYFTILD